MIHVLSFILKDPTYYSKEKLFLRLQASQYLHYIRYNFDVNNDRNIVLFL